MGRTSEGWSLRWHKATGTWLVWWWHEGKRSERSTRVRDKRDRATAGAKAAALYAAAITGTEQRGSIRPQGNLKEWVGAWIDDLPVRDPTRRHYENYSVAWLRRWPRISEWTDQAMVAWVRERLRTVRAKTVRTESSALRCLLRWLTEQGLFSVPPVVPALPPGAAGRPAKRRSRTRAPELSPAEVRRLLAALPLRSNRDGWPIRARFVLAYETTLRPGTLDRISVPENYSKRGRVLRVWDSDDKEGEAREIPLSPKARAALESVCPAQGLIFGAHRYDPYLRIAARRVLPADKAAILCGQHVRSAAITHMLEDSSDLPGVMHFAGHVRPETTGRYTRPSLRAARNVLRKRRRT